MRVTLNKKTQAEIIIAPSSKSYEQRILACALLSGNDCRITNFGKSEDVIAARTIIGVLGAKSEIKNEILHINRKNISETNILDCNESALCARMFAPIACTLKDNFIITGTGSLLLRNIADDFSILEQMGCKISHNSSNIPITFQNAKLKAGNYIIDGSKTSQFISGLLLSLPTLNTNSQIIVKKPASINYILLSIEIAKMFGVEIISNFNKNSELIINIKHSQKYIAPSNPITIEGDWSGSAFLLIAGAIYGKVTINGLNKNSTQPDSKLLNVFDISNINYFWDNQLLCVEKSEPKAFKFDAKDCPDLIPALIILAIFADGTSKITGASRLVNKESSRGKTMQNELSKLGIKITIDNDSIEIKGKQKPTENILDSNNDHRIAMALSIMSGLFANGLEIENAESIKKSYPDFYNDLKKVVVYN
jgi:3-phosphoshikimate 1-carboxyvinyltransferase